MADDKAQEAADLEMVSQLFDIPEGEAGPLLAGLDDDEPNDAQEDDDQDAGDEELEEELGDDESEDESSEELPEEELDDEAEDDEELEDQTSSSESEEEAGGDELTTLRQQFRELQEARARDQAFTDLGRLHAQQLQRERQQPQQQQQQRPAGYGPEVLQALNRLSDPQLTREEAAKRYQALSPDVQRKVLEAQDHEQRTLREFALNTDSFVGHRILPHVQQAVQQIVQPLLQKIQAQEARQWWKEQEAQHPGVIESDDDRRWILEKMQKGSKSEDAILLLQARKRSEKVGKKEQRVRRKEKDQAALKRSRRRSQGKKSGRRGRPKPSKKALETMDLEQIALEAMERGVELEIE